MITTRRGPGIIGTASPRAEALNCVHTPSPKTRTPKPQPICYIMVYYMLCVLLLSVRLVWNRRATLLHEICMLVLLSYVGDRRGHFGAKRSPPDLRKIFLWARYDLGPGSLVLEPWPLGR